MTTATTATITTMSQPDLNTITQTNSLNDESTNNIIGNFDDDDDQITNNEGVVSSKTTTLNGFHQQTSSTKNTNNNNHISNSSANIVSNNNGSSNHRATSDHAKRKKLKSRSSTAPAANGYMKDHLDAWLETCLKDASNAQLSSSSEFLDFNPANPINKNNFHLQQKNQQNQHQPVNQKSLFQQNSQQQYQSMQTPFGQSALQSSKTSKFSQPQLHQQQQQQQQQQPYLFGMSSSASGPFSFQNSNNGGSTPFCQGFQRSMMPNYMKYTTTPAFNNRFAYNFPSSGAYFPQNNGSQDFASLPPIVNMLGVNVDSSEHDIHSTDVLDGSSSHPNISRGFRFSDPCLLNPSDEEESKVSDQNPSKSHTNGKMTNESESNKFFAALMEQINLLHETNSKICRNLHETKVDIEALKNAPNWVGMRHRRDSLSGLSTHSQPMMFGGGFGSHSPAPTYHSGSYAPGMVSDLVREVKDAARVREDALLNRVKALVEERQWSLNESNLRIMRDIEDLKSQVRQLRSERKESNKRISHLESENKYMRQMLTTLFNNRHSNEIIYENETLRSRKHLVNAKRSHSLNLHYGTIHHPSSVSLEEELDEGLHIRETPSSVSTADIATIAIASEEPEKRTSLSSTDSSLSTSESVELKPKNPSNGTTRNASIGNVPSPPNFALISSPEDESVTEKLGKRPEKDKVKDSNDEKLLLKSSSSPKKLNEQELRKELKEAVTAKKEADRRLIAWV